MQFSIILLGGIFNIMWKNRFFISQGDWELDLVMLTAVLSLIAAGPGRMFIASLIK